MNYSMFQWVLIHPDTVAMGFPDRGQIEDICIGETLPYRVRFEDGTLRKLSDNQILIGEVM